MKIKDLLKRLGACKDAIEWVGDKTVHEAWETCHRGDWMLWFYQKQYPCNIKEITLAKAHCATTVRHLIRDDRSLKAIDVAISFGKGMATKEELATAADAAYAAADAAYAAYIDAADAVAVADATYAAAYAVYAAADTTYAAYAAADTATAESRQQAADICRKYLSIDFKLYNCS